MNDTRPYGTLAQDHWLVRSFNARPITTIFAVVAFAILLGIGGWWLTTALSGPTGAGQVHRDTNSAANREAANTKIVGGYQQVAADQAQIAIINGVKDPTNQDRIDLTGAKLNCTQDVSAYNAATSSILLHPYIPVGYPSILSDDVCLAGADSLPVLD